MKKFMAIYMGSPSTKASAEWEALDKEAQQKRSMEAMKAWQAWGKQYASQILDDGAPLGRTKKTDKTGVADIKNMMTAYTIIQAESHEAAAKMFINHPHFAIFPGDSVEIMEILPMPTM